MDFTKEFISSIVNYEFDYIAFSDNEVSTSKRDFIKEIIIKRKYLKTINERIINISGEPCRDNISLLLAAASCGMIIEISDNDLSKIFSYDFSLAEAQEFDLEDEINKLCDDFMSLIDQSSIVLFTSGTTGKPKRVVLPFSGMCYQSFMIANDLMMHNKDRQLFYMPLNYVYGLTVALSTIYSDASLIKSQYTLDEPNSFFNQINDLNITCFSGVPFTYDILVSRWGVEKLKGSSLRQMTQAGGRLSIEKKKR